MSSLIRTRWAAIGATVAVTLGAGGIGIVSATQPDDAVAFVPITPCRVMDTRTEFNVGPKTSPLGPGEIYTVNTTTADTGNCTGIPTTATGVSLNITALDATLPTFLTVWATGAAQPEASSLNPVPGAPPTPNAVTTGINTNGQFDIYNLQGNVHVIVDVVGYYTDHHHDDRYYTEAETYTKPQVDGLVATLNSRVDALETLTSELNAERPFAWTNRDDSEEIGSTAETVVSVNVTAPAAGNITVISTTTVREDTADQFVGCSISNSAAFDFDYIQRWNSPGGIVRDSQLSGVRVFDINAGQTVTYQLVCYNLSGGTSLTYDATIAAIFTPGP